MPKTAAESLYELRSTITSKKWARVGFLLEVYDKALPGMHDQVREEQLLGAYFSCIQ